MMRRVRYSSEVIGIGAQGHQQPQGDRTAEALRHLLAQRFLQVHDVLRFDLRQIRIKADELELVRRIRGRHLDPNRSEIPHQLIVHEFQRGPQAVLADQQCDRGRAAGVGDASSGGRC